MMLGVLVYCYARGTSSDRGIERFTHENFAVRLLTEDTHPVHDSICALLVKIQSFSRAAFTKCSKWRRASKCCAWAM